MIDWITIQQKHRLAQGQKLPILNSGRVVFLSVDEQGLMSIEHHTDKRFQHKGSYDTSVQLVCDGQTVKFSGNIGRLGRPDNVFNLTITETIFKLNALLAQHKLPPFTFERPKYIFCESTNKDEIIPHHGAEITRLDITRNYATGKDNAYQMMDLLATKSIGHVKNGRSKDGATVSWGKRGGRNFTKAYIKHLEMVAHAKGLDEQGNKKKDVILQSGIYQFCEDNGIVRIEIELDRKTLLENEMRYGVGLNMNALRQLFDSRVNEIAPVTKFTAKSLDLSDLPKKLRAVATLYYQKNNMQDLYSRATFYRHAKALREYGIDITIPFKGQKTFQPVIKQIVLNPIYQPDWYRIDGSVRYQEHVSANERKKRKYLRVV